MTTLRAGGTARCMFAVLTSCRGILPRAPEAPGVTVRQLVGRSTVLARALGIPHNLAVPPAYVSQGGCQ